MGLVCLKPNTSWQTYPGLMQCSAILLNVLAFVAAEGTAVELVGDRQSGIRT